MYQSAICRNESLDVLGHLSSDGCMRPWYALCQRLLHEALELIVTSADVLHSWAVSSLGVECDAVPGRHLLAHN